MVTYITVKSKERTACIDITETVQDVVRDSGITNGVCHLFVAHTTAALTINEGADPSVMRDMRVYLDTLVPFDGDYHHAEGNSAAHIKSTLVGVSENIFIEQGKLSLGTWQAVFFCEFDGPRTRKVAITISGT
jgi:secondary thiamine-phosphate synthase enzyme